MDTMFFLLANGRTAQAYDALRARCTSVMEEDLPTMRDVFHFLVAEALEVWARQGWADADLDAFMGIMESLVRDLLDLTVEAGLITPARHLTLV